MDLKLFVALLGGKDVNYLLEQHKVHFCVCRNLEELKSKAKEYWSSVSHLNIDMYMCLDQVCGHKVIIQDNCGFSVDVAEPNKKLFLVNIGGYREGVFDEIHKKIFVVASSVDEAKVLARQDSFFKEMLQDEHCRPHVDDVIDVDDALSIQAYSIKLEEILNTDEIRDPKPVITGYLKV